MERLQGLIWLLRQVVDAVTYVWAVWVVLGPLAVLSFLIRRGWQRKRFLVASGRLALSLFGYLVIILALSVVFARESATRAGQAIAWPAYLVTGVLLVHFAISLALILREPGNRIRLLPIVLVTLWVSICSWFVALLTVSGAASL